MRLDDKYSQLSEHFTERSYGNPEQFMGHRAEVTMSWGRSLRAGDRVLELGCGDGYLGCLLAKRGLHYTGMDFAQGMVDAAKQRMAAEGADGRCVVMNINSIRLQESFDGVVAFCRTFFAYAESPDVVLHTLRPFVRKKLIVDWNHYSPVKLANAVTMVRRAGFKEVRCRPFLVPMKRILPPFWQQLLFRLEHVPLLGVAPARWKFQVLIKGEAT
jgi:ubiquinone/menaquinone biosynthesis C-methylase UbiE